MMREWFKARNVWGAAITALSDEEAGRLAKAIWTYTMTGEVIELEGAGKGIFALILMTLAQDEDHNAEISFKRSKATEEYRNQKKASDDKKDQLTSNDIKSNQLTSNDDNKNKNKSKNKEKEKEKENKFAQFWTAYPRKASKPAAQKAFIKLNPDDALMQTMLTAIERQKASAQWQENGGQYIPYPATWLNNHRWEDEVKQDQQKKSVNAQAYSQRDYEDEDAEAVKRFLRVVNT